MTNIQLKIRAAFLALLLLSCTACTGNKNQEPVNMDELMKIGTWLLDDELEGTGRWGYIASSTRTFPYTADGNGYWIPDEGVGDSLVSSDTLAGRDYTIQIQGCSMGGEPIVTAVVKLTAIEDPEYPWQTIHSTHYGEHHRANEERTRFCSVELISYTYSEMYIFGGAAGELGS